MVLLVVLFVAFLMMAFRLTPAAVIEAVRSHERVPYEPVEEEDLPPQHTHVPRRSAPVHTPDAAIDIPLDGEERVIRKKIPRAASSARSPIISRAPTSC